MKKVIIIGPSGAGKSTLARQLAQKLDVQHIELDSLKFRENWESVDKAEFRNTVFDITKTDGWVLCGNYFKTLGIDFWKQADTIIWCNYSFPFVFQRLLKRTVRRSWKKEELWHGNKEDFKMSFFSRDSILLYVMTNWNTLQKMYRPIFSRPAELPNTTLIELKRPSEANSLLL